MTTSTDFAVIIPTLNSGKTLRRCLDSILSQAPPPAEVVVVDDVQTSDDTRAIVESAGARLIVSPAKMAESRNVGVINTASSLLLSLDSDMFVAPGLLRTLVELFSASQVSAATIAEVSVGKGYWARCRAIDKLSVELTGYGRSMRAFRRDLFTSIGGYDVNLEAGEDADFHRRAVSMGAHVAHVASPPILHDEGYLTIASVVRKKYRYGRSLGRFHAKHGGALANGYIVRILVGARASITADPLTLPGFVVMKATDALAGAAGRLAQNGASRRLSIY